MGWLRTRSRWWENLVLLAAVFILFRPNFLMDYLYDPYQSIPAKEWSRVVGEIPEDGRFMVTISGTTIEGEDKSKALALRLGSPAEPRKRLSDAGLTIVPLGGQLQIASVRSDPPRRRRASSRAGASTASAYSPTGRTRSGSSCSDLQ
jgi:hypothetical protein